MTKPLQQCQARFEEQPAGTVIPVDPSEKTQQEQPASVDAYVGAREDTAIWKKRALEAEELNRKFIAEVNGPTYLGEPVKQEQPAQEPLAVVPRTMILEDADLRFLHGLSQPDDEDGSFSPIALTVGYGHAGHGLYASLSEYPEEGADIICKFDRSEAQQDQPAQDLYPLPDSLYPGSKDWQAGSYKERVEWLHGMYESAKQEIARLEAQQAQEPVMYQYRWLNPGDNPDQPESELEWKLVEVRNVYTDTIANRIDELRGYRFSGKPVYEVRPLYAAPPTQPALSEAGIERACEAVAAALGDACDCGRVWSAWRIGTMSEDDFFLVSEDQDRVREIAVAAIEAHCRGGADK